MAATEISGRQIKDGSVQRKDLDITTTGQAVIRKIIAGSGVSISWNGADSGTGDVTITSSGAAFQSNDSWIQWRDSSDISYLNTIKVDNSNNLILNADAVSGAIYFQLQQNNAFALTSTSNLRFYATDFLIQGNSVDNSDNQSITLTPANTTSLFSTRGASVRVFGNEHASLAGILSLESGDKAGSNVLINAAATNGNINLRTAGTDRVVIGANAVEISNQLQLSSGTASAPSLFFAGNSTTGLFLSASNSIGFTTNGTQRIEVTNSGLGINTGRIYNVAGTQTDPSYSFSGNLNTGMFRPATNSIGFSLNGTEQVRITSTGSVGIGTTGPSARLEIVAENTTAKGLIVKGVTSQSANLVEVQNATGTALVSISPSGVLTLNNQLISNVATPVSASDVATKSYVDAITFPMDVKASCRVASTANVVISSALIAGSVIDGVTLATGNRVLLKNQSNASQNGIYVVVASGAASRAPDADSNSEVTANMFVFVSEGTTQADTQWVLTTNDVITLGATSLTFAQFGSAPGSGLNTLNTLSTTSQTFATGTTGTNFAISSSGSTHTFNLPDASASARGLITNATQTIAGTKTFSDGFNVGNLFSSSRQNINYTLNGDGWIKLCTLISPSTCKIIYRAGSGPTEEMGEIDIRVSYLNANTQIQITRHTYNYHLEEVRVTSVSAGGPKIIYVKLRSTGFSSTPFLQWRLVNADISAGAITIHSIEEVPSAGVSVIAPTLNFQNIIQSNSNLLLSSENFESTLSRLQLSTGAATTKGITLRAASSQSASLLDLQNSSGVSIFTVDSSGSLSAGTVPVARISGLASVATSGSYDDLTNKPTIVSNLDSLTDVIITSPSTNQVLSYNGTNWVNSASAASGITSLNALTSGTQTFATGTTGTNFNISSSGSTHTFNIPDASDTARGVITTGVQTIAGAKTFSAAPNLSSLSASLPLKLDASKNVTSAAISLSSGSSEITGTLAVTNGGTGATSASSALTNLTATQRSTTFPANNESSVKAADLRTITNPLTGLGYAQGVRFRFSSLNDDNISPYADVIDLSTYSDNSGGGFNSIYFGKNSQVIKHKYAAAGGTSWTTKDIPYTSSGSANYLARYSDALTLTTSNIYDSGTNIGIGTTNPQETLHLRSASPKIRLEDTDGGGAYAQISGNSTVGAIVLQANPSNAAVTSYIGFELEGTERLRISDNGSIVHKSHTSGYSGSSSTSVTSVTNTTDATTSTLHSLTLDDNTLYKFRVEIVGRFNSSVAKGVWGSLDFGVYRNNAGVATLAGTRLKVIDAYGGATYDFDVDVSTNDVRVRVTGATSETVSWTADIKIVSVSTSA